MSRAPLLERLTAPDGRMPRQVQPGWLVALMVADTVAAVGLFGDIARHVSLGFAVDTESDFLSSWHLVLYGGVAGVALVLGAFAVAHGPRAPVVLLRRASGGLAALTLGGIVDAVWHEAFGIEASFGALVSPPHLVVFAGLVLLMIAPIGVVADGPSVPLDALRSLVLALSVTSLLLVISLFTGYLTPLIGGSEFQAGAYVESLVGTSYLDQDTARGLGVTLWFGTLLSLVVVLIRARSAPVAGTWTVAFGLLGLAPLVATGEVALPLTAALVVFGILSDLTATRSRPHPLATGLTVAAMWAAMFSVIGARGDLLWGRELWGGVITTGFLVGTATGGAIRWVTSPPRVAPRADVGL
ncbi:MAG TPA: hypothetical protein VGO60_04705 [Iamia sp.]|nr:hypothetical protein [Iamia sp.]